MTQPPHAHCLVSLSGQGFIVIILASIIAITSSKNIIVITFMWSPEIQMKSQWCAWIEARRHVRPLFVPLYICCPDKTLVFSNWHCRSAQLGWVSIKIMVAVTDGLWLNDPPQLRSIAPISTLRPPRRHHHHTLTSPKYAKFQSLLRVFSLNSVFGRTQRHHWSTPQFILSTSILPRQSRGKISVIHEGTREQ